MQQKQTCQLCECCYGYELKQLSNYIYWLNMNIITVRSWVIGWRSWSAMFNSVTPVCCTPLWIASANGTTFFPSSLQWTTSWLSLPTSQGMLPWGFPRASPARCLATFLSPWVIMSSCLWFDHVIMLVCLHPSCWNLFKSSRVEATELATLEIYIGIPRIDQPQLMLLRNDQTHVGLVGHSTCGQLPHNKLTCTCFLDMAKDETWHDMQCLTLFIFQCVSQDKIRVITLKVRNGSLRHGHQLL